MKNLLLFVLLLLPLLANAQTLKFEGSEVNTVSVTGESTNTVTDKTGYVKLSDSLITVFEFSGEMTTKDNAFTKDVIFVAQGINNSKGYYISPEEYFVLTSEILLHVRKLGRLWIYEKLKIK